MKALSRIAILVFVLLGIYSCAKKDDTTNSSSNTTNSNPQPTVTSFSVNGVAANSPIPGASTIGRKFVISATDGVYSYPQIKITFPDTLAPISGPYTIVQTPISAFQCSFMLTTATSSTVTPTITSTASLGTVTVTAAATPNNSASFSNIICTNTGTTTTTFTVSGTIKY